MANPENPKGTRFNTEPHAAIDLTIEQASEIIDAYLPGGEKFQQGTTDRVIKSHNDNPSSVRESE